MSEPDEPRAVAARYARRTADSRYDSARPEVQHMLRERERALQRLFARIGWQGQGNLADKRVIEVGCGSGGNLQRLLDMGFTASYLSGIELLPERHAAARSSLPPEVELLEGDASAIERPEASVDAVLVATVFSSLLDPTFQQRLAATLWRWVKPGGGVIWYDFTVDNPRNPDVRGVPLTRIQALFPEGHITHERITLAPPLARATCRLHPQLYPLLNAIPLLRTHVLAWVAKPG